MEGSLLGLDNAKKLAAKWQVVSTLSSKVAFRRCYSFSGLLEISVAVIRRESGRALACFL